MSNPFLLKPLSSLSLSVFLVAISGCVEETPPPRPVVIERPVVQQPYVEDVVAPQAPPADVVEVVPTPRPGYIWVHAHWRWNGANYVAVRGHWEAIRPGYRYIAAHWVHRPDGWHWRNAEWVYN